MFLLRVIFASKTDELRRRRRRYGNCGFDSFLFKERKTFSNSGLSVCGRGILSGTYPPPHDGEKKYTVKSNLVITKSTGLTYFITVKVYGVK